MPNKATTSLKNPVTTLGMGCGVVCARIQVRSATLLHSSSHAHLFEYDGWLLKA